MFKKIAAAAALIAVSATAFAAEAPALYVGLDVGSTKIDNFERDEGIGAFVGYKFNETFAVEGGYHRLSNTEYRFGTLRGDISVDQIDLSLLGTLPLSNGFNLYGRLGYNRLEIDSDFSGDNHDSGVLYGVGLGYSFSPVISGRLEVQKPASDTTRVAVGIAYKF